MNGAECGLMCLVLSLAIPQKRPLIKVPMANGDWVGYFCLDKIYQIFSRDLNLQPGGKHDTKTVLP